METMKNNKNGGLEAFGSVWWLEQDTFRSLQSVQFENNLEVDMP